jgi:hypothetical protein
MKPFRLLIALAAVLGGAIPALAAEAIFPAGARVGLVPAVGLSKAKTFQGFESEDQSVKVLVTELPADAYTEVVNAFKTNPSGVNGIKPETVETASGLAYYTAENAKDGANNVRRYSMIIPGSGFSGYVAVQVPENATKIVNDEAVRQMFATAVTRKTVPVDEQLALMPFKVDELSGFKNVRTLAPGSALLLADGDEADLQTKPFMVLGIVSGAPQAPEDRARFAQETATQVPGIREARITMSEQIRVQGSPAFETRIDGVSGKENTPVTVVQWIRFGSGNSLRIIGSAPRDQWSEAFTRFRAVRDGINPKG